MAELIQLANRHPRVNILQPGPGVGGHCIAVDPWFIVSKTPEQARLIRTAREVNDSKPHWVIDQVKIKIADYLQQHPSKTIQDIKLACYGLAFKADIDDLRESPALDISLHLFKHSGCQVVAVEPNLNVNQYQDIPLVDLIEAEQADIRVLLVKHREFKSIDFGAKAFDLVI